MRKYFTWQRVATWAVTAGSFVASTFIPAAAVITAGPVVVPVAGLVTGTIAALAAAGIVPSPTLGAFLGAFLKKK
jgi:hypothetical protein